MSYARKVEYALRYGVDGMGNEGQEYVDAADLIVELERQRDELISRSFSSKEEAERYLGLERQRDELAKALRCSMTALDDWLNLYAEEECDPIRVSEAHQRIKEYGTVWYIAEVQQQNREAIAKIEGERK